MSARQFFHRLMLLWLALASPVVAKDQQAVIVAVGAGGSDEYAGEFAEWARRWQEAAAAADVPITTIGLAAEETDAAAKLATAVSGAVKESKEPLWLVLLGHGTATGGEAKFNLRGTDVNAAQVAEWLKSFHRPVIVICGFSTSGAWMKPLSAPGRVIVTATRSSAERNFSRFGGHFSKSLSNPEADLDQDGQTSLLEAYVAASRKTADWYAQEGRLATEHALLDDNGDGAGTPADWFKGTRAVKKPRAGAADGAAAHQLHLLPSKEERALPAEIRAKRNELERDLARLRERKAEMVEEEYLEEMEKILLQLARLYRSAGSPEGRAPAASPPAQPRPKVPASAD